MNDDGVTILMQILWLKGLEPWEVPLLVMAVILAPISAAWLFGWLKEVNGHGPPPEPNTSWISRIDWERVRTAALALLTGLIFVFFTQVIGPTGADKLATVASAVSAMVGVFLTLQSYLDHRTQKSEKTESNKNSGGDANAA